LVWTPSVRRSVPVTRPPLSEKLDVMTPPVPALDVPGARRARSLKLRLSAGICATSRGVMMVLAPTRAARPLSRAWREASTTTASSCAAWAERAKSAGTRSPNRSTIPRCRLSW
jgi:hypothetical protein